METMIAIVVLSLVRLAIPAALLLLVGGWLRAREQKQSR